MGLSYRNLSTLGKFYSILSSFSVRPIFFSRSVKSQRLGFSMLSIFYSQTCGEFPFSFSALSSIPNSQLTLKLDRRKCSRILVFDLQISLDDRPVKSLEQVRVISISLSIRVPVRASWRLWSCQRPLDGNL